MEGATHRVLAAMQGAKIPVRADLDAVLRHAESVDDVAWHPTGFVVATIARQHVGVLRLHIWPDDERSYGEPLWPIHDHVWSLRSLVLVGQVRSEHADVVDAQGGSFRRYAVRYEPGHQSQLVADGPPVRRDMVRSRSTPAGAMYTVQAGEFHASSAATGCLAATLVATQPTSRRYPFVLGPVDGPSAVAVRRRPVASARWRALVSRVRDDMQRQSLAAPEI